MSRYPFASWVPAGTPGGPIEPRVLILHTEATVGNASPHSGLEWHFMVFNNGLIDQLVDTNQRADANYHANPFAISVETEDDGSPDADPWTDEQVKAIVALCRWANREHGIPLRRCDRWDGSGIGFHTMWGAPSEWTPVSKTCPGAARKAQFENVILPALAAVTPAPRPPAPRLKDPGMYVATCTGKPTRLKDGPTCPPIGQAAVDAAKAAGVPVIPHTPKEYEWLLQHCSEALGRDIVKAIEAQ